MANAMSRPEIAARVQTAIARTFQLAGNGNTAEFRMGALPGWDSLGHMRLVTELEEEFGLTFPAYMIAELLDFDRIVDGIENLQQA
jgi:acyl carrier protein